MGTQGKVQLAGDNRADGIVYEGVGSGEEASL
jgi:hypothetical protein